MDSFSSDEFLLPLLSRRRSVISLATVRPSIGIRYMPSFPPNKRQTLPLTRTDGMYSDERNYSGIDYVEGAAAQESHNLTYNTFVP